MKFSILKFILFVSVFSFFNCFSQKEVLEEVAFADIDQVPVYKGCWYLKTNKERRMCMEKRLSRHFSKRFNGNVVRSKCVEFKKKGKKEICVKSEYWPGFSSGLVQIFTQFKIDKQGDVVDIKVRAPHVKYKEEAERVLNLIPNMEPGIIDGKKVGVLYALPITLRLE